MRNILKLSFIAVFWLGAGNDAFAADAEKGAHSFRLCRACHTIEEGGPNRIGPNLFGVFGRNIASKEGFNYSDALQTLEGDWDAEKLNQFLLSPRTYVPGTKMTFGGLRKSEDRANLIAWLETQRTQK